MASADSDRSRADLLLAASCSDDLQYPGPANLPSEHDGLRVPAKEGRAVFDFVVNTTAAEIESFLVATGQAIGDID